MPIYIRRYVLVVKFGFKNYENQALNPKKL